MKKILNNNEEYYEDEYPVIYNTPINYTSNYIDNIIEVEVINDLYKLVNIKDKETNDVYEQEKLVKKGCKSKETFYKSDIIGVKEILNVKGLPYKTKCQIKTKFGENITIKGNYNDYNNRLFNKEIIPHVGFKIW